MREIKFRGKRKDNGEWIFGYLMQMHQPERLFIGVWRSIGGEATIKDELFFSYREVDPETVGQFTGIGDIYEGDIVRVFAFHCDDEPELNEYTNHVVKWMGGNDYPAFEFEPLLSDEVNGLSDMIGNPEYHTWGIIGNIHENPELLK